MTTDEARRAPARARPGRGRGRGPARALQGRRPAREARPRALARRLARDAGVRPDRATAAGRSRRTASSAGTGTARSAISCSTRSCARRSQRPACTCARRRRGAVLPDRRSRLLGARGSRSAGLVAALTATSPRRLPHPDGGPPLTGTNPLAIAIPVERRPAGRRRRLDGRGDARRRARRARRQPEELVPFGGEQAHKAFALAAGHRAARRRARRAGARRRARRRAAGARSGAVRSAARRGQAAPRRLGRTERDESGCEFDAARPLAAALRPRCPFPSRRMPRRLTVALGRVSGAVRQDRRQRRIAPLHREQVVDRRAASSPRAPAASRCRGAA